MDKNFGGAALPFHWKIADPSGESIIIEITDQGHVEIFDAFLGVITNSPGYKWHLTNMRNYLGLQPEAFGTVEIDKFSFSPLGSGTGLHGLPGDYTPSSRFVGAAALTATARPLKNSYEAVFEAFRILDNFNIPSGATVKNDQIASDIKGTTQITTAHDLRNQKMYFHTMSDRQVRMLDLKKINFNTVKHKLLNIGESRQQTIKEIFLSK